MSSIVLLPLLPHGDRIKNFLILWFHGIWTLCFTYEFPQQHSLMIRYLELVNILFPESHRSYERCLTRSDLLEQLFRLYKNKICPRFQRTDLLCCYREMVFAEKVHILLRNDGCLPHTR